MYPIVFKINIYCSFHFHHVESVCYLFMCVIANFLFEYFLMQSVSSICISRWDARSKQTMVDKNYQMIRPTRQIH